MSKLLKKSSNNHTIKVLVNMTHSTYKITFQNLKIYIVFVTKIKRYHFFALFRFVRQSYKGLLITNIRFRISLILIVLYLTRSTDIKIRTLLDRIGWDRFDPIILLRLNPVMPITVFHDVLKNCLIRFKTEIIYVFVFFCLE